jgi:hypothetical protein
MRSTLGSVLEAARGSFLEAPLTLDGLNIFETPTADFWLFVGRELEQIEFINVCTVFSRVCIHIQKTEF